MGARRTTAFILITLFLVSLLNLGMTNPTYAEGSPTTLFFNPSTFEVPLLNIGQGTGNFYIDLYMNNVQNLKEFEITVIWDGDILDFYDVHPSIWSGGGTWYPKADYGSHTINRVNLTRPPSGSGIFLRYEFTTKKPGSTIIQISNLRLTDISGASISYTVSGTSEVTVKSSAEWIDGEYLKLQDKYSQLQTDYNKTKTDYSNLQTQYTDLETDYRNLQTQNTGLETDYNNLQSQYTGLEANVSNLQSKYGDLANQHGILQTQYQQSTEKLTAKNNEINVVKYILYGFVAVTVILIISGIYILVSRRKKKAVGL